MLMVNRRFKTFSQKMYFNFKSLSGGGWPQHTHWVFLVLDDRQHGVDAHYSKILVPPLRCAVKVGEDYRGSFECPDSWSLRVLSASIAGSGHHLISKSKNYICERTGDQFTKERLVSVSAIAGSGTVRTPLLFVYVTKMEPAGSGYQSGLTSVHERVAESASVTTLVNLYKT